MKTENDSTSRVLTEEDLVERFGRPRNYSLVFSNGVFDLLHAGHIASLEAARALGDRLVVAVNADSSACRLKGADRPVTIFGEDTPADLIERLLPDVLVKGADYSLQEIAGSDAVIAAGGEVRLIALEASRSTTGLIERIRASEESRG
jgi:D-beta-D-heptose 7-phosphate kinase/D-beta-D-heptose 1-phosphate adenosyltransferase